jgi:hypothetical protein
MDLRHPVVWQGLAATGVGALVVLGSAWWLYLAPLPGGRSVPRLSTSPRIVGWLTLAVGLAALQFMIGGLWDASQHIKTGRVVGGADFLWPSHIVLYGSFLLALVAASSALAVVALPAWRMGARDPRLWVRQQPYLALVALASAYELLAIPGDALWHQLFGIDLTAWSPPHLLLAGMMGFVQIGAIGMLRHARRGARPRGWVAAAEVILLGLALNAFYLVGVLEWELPVDRSPLVEARPIWLYPVVSASLAFGTLVLARVLVDWRWAATATALAFYVIRIGLSVGLAATDNVAPVAPLTPLLGGFLLDMVARQHSATGLYRTFLSAVSFTAGFALLAIPALYLRADLPRFSLGDLALTLLVTLLVCLVLWPMMTDIGQALRGRRALASARRLRPHTPPAGPPARPPGVPPGTRTQPGRYTSGL